VKAGDIEEKGKGTVSRPLLKKDESIDRAIHQLRAGGKKKNEVSSYCIINLFDV